MKAFDLLEAIGTARDSYIAEVEAIRSGQAQPRRIFWRRTVLIAAVIVMTLLLVGCAVALLLNLNSLSFHQEQQTDQRTGQTQVWNLVSLQGLVGSDNYKATQEWYEFTQNDQSAYDDSEAIDWDYFVYRCYSQEGKEKIDELCETYGLKLLGEPLNSDLESLLYALNIPHIIRIPTTADVQTDGGACYSGGSFFFYGAAALTRSDWKDPIEFQFRCVMKDVFDNTYLNVGDIREYDQWTYSAPDGTQLSLALSQRMGLILLDREDFFLTIQVQNPSFQDLQGNVRTMSRKNLESFAAIFDYSFTPQPLSPEIALMIDVTDYDVENYFPNLSIPESAPSAPKIETYDEKVKEVLETSTEPERLGYAFLDIDGDGKEELLIGKDGYCTYIFTEVDGEVVTYADFFNYMWNYPCEGGILVSVMDAESIDYFIRTIQDGQTTTATHIQYSPASPVEPERWILYLDWNEREPITQQEFEDILEGNTRIPVTMQPLMDYPLEDPVARSTSRQSAYYESYEAMIRMYLTNQPERWYRWAYAILDLDGNGQEELVWREDSREMIYTMDQGDTIMLLYGRDLTVCKNGYVEIIQSYSGENKTYCYYRIDGNQAVLVDYLRYDADVNPDNPWFYSTDATGQDMSLISISAEQAQSIRDQYHPMDLTLTPIAQSPYAQAYQTDN